MKAMTSMALMGTISMGPTISSHSFAIACLVQTRHAGPAVPSTQLTTLPAFQTRLCSTYVRTHVSITLLETCLELRAYPTGLNLAANRFISLDREIQKAQSQ